MKIMIIFASIFIVKAMANKEKHTFFEINFPIALGIISQDLESLGVEQILRDDKQYYFYQEILKLGTDLLKTNENDKAEENLVKNWAHDLCVQKVEDKSQTKLKNLFKKIDLTCINAITIIGNTFRHIILTPSIVNVTEITK
ncbi:uncharacterized protein LOC126899722 [Daktulosphaira vitifoliae]|uniref:uncharacterized protein LOC126899722 n=1 Tax=Daktulosphaira vitifoliae TaxID=58002 RepID=UPI0021AAA3FD|nr:uncharacterized protein LOC126899722 [Daktulosphaira vitifoliae]